MYNRSLEESGKRGDPEHGGQSGEKGLREVTNKTVVNQGRRALREVTNNTVVNQGRRALREMTNNTVVTLAEIQRSCVYMGETSRGTTLHPIWALWRVARSKPLS